MKVVLKRGYSKESYKDVAFNFDSITETENFFKVARNNIKEDGEHFRIDITEDNIGKAYGGFIDIDNKEGVLLYEEAKERLMILGINFVSYKSFSSGKDGKDRYRIFVPFASSCLASLFYVSMQDLVSMLVS